MTRRTLLVAALGTMMAMAGCSAASSRGAGGSGDRITREQLETIGVITTYDAIQRLRPSWLQTRGAFSVSAGTGVPRVHINDSRTGTLDDLRSLPTTSVETIQYMSASDATTLFGTGYPGGLIEVRTRRSTP
jgi:hypothetical protein